VAVVVALAVAYRYLLLKHQAGSANLWSRDGINKNAERPQPGSSMFVQLQPVSVFLFTRESASCHQISFSSRVLESYKTLCPLKNMGMPPTVGREDIF
jgi:hypothetical protein